MWFQNSCFPSREKARTPELYTRKSLLPSLAMEIRWEALSVFKPRGLGAAKLALIINSFWGFVRLTRQTPSVIKLEVTFVQCVVT